MRCSPVLRGGCGGCGAAPLRRAQPVSGIEGLARRAHRYSLVSSSVFDLYKIGMGPSSSHTVGPMVACRNFVKHVRFRAGGLEQVERVSVALHGSMALTGVGHATDVAVLLGLSGARPATVVVEEVQSFVRSIRESGRLLLWLERDGDTGALRGGHEVRWDERADLAWVPEPLPGHPNGMVCTAYAEGGREVHRETYYSVGGGFVLTEDELRQREKGGGDDAAGAPPLPVPFTSARHLLEQCDTHGLSIAGVMRANECARRGEAEVAAGLAAVWRCMDECIDRGTAEAMDDAELPGGLGLRRRAPAMLRKLRERRPVERTGARHRFALLSEMSWLNTYALAVNEENAAMGRVVTAPTNGAAGVVPAVLAYYMRHLRDDLEPEFRRDAEEFLLTAGAVGLLAKEHAAISGAEAGCQGEVGTATSMAAAGLAAVLGATPEQVENAAEIAMEHSLGMTCDPVAGLVQLPCIERNGMGAVKAVNAAALALRGDGSHACSLDRVLRVMKQTGRDMNARYRETAQGGLAEEFASAGGLSRTSRAPQRNPLQDKVWRNIAYAAC